MHCLKARTLLWLAVIILLINISAVEKIHAAPTAVISGAPPSLTNADSATMMISGDDVVSYKYRLNGEIYSSEIPRNMGISRSYLGDGLYTVYVLGKDSFGEWQETPTTASWTVDTVAPETTINAKRPANPSVEKSGSFSFAATETGSAFECRMDSTAYASCTSPYTFASLADGSHTFSARATDKAGNADQSAASYTWTIDTIAPDTAIVAKPANPSNEKTGSFSFSMSETGSFECSMDGSTYAPCTTPSGFTSLTEGSHIFSVRAKDTAGNLDATPASYSWVMDTVPPVLTLSTLSDGAVTAGALLNITGITDRSDIRLAINDVTVPVNTDGTFSHALELTSGPNLITTVAADLAGNEARDTRTITLDQTGPAISIEAPSDNSMTNMSFVEVHGTVSEASAIEIKVENSSGTNLAAKLAAVTTEFSATVNLAAGLNTIHVSGTDLLGNKSATEKRTVTLDEQKPSLAITQPAQDARTGLANMIIKGTVTDTLGAVAVTITRYTVPYDPEQKDTETFIPQVENSEFAQEVRFTADKMNHIVVSARDEAGNETIVQRNIFYTRISADGDMDSNGKVGVDDALTALQVAMGMVHQTDGYLLRGDVAPLVEGRPAPDGKITLGDAVIILQVAIGMVHL